MDYRSFLGREELLTLPYLGGASVAASGRALRLDASAQRTVDDSEEGSARRAKDASSLEVGWWRFRVKGRVAQALERVDPPEDVLASLAVVRGHLSGSWLATDDARTATVHLLPEDEPARFAPCRSRRWHDGQLLFEQIDLETDAEEGTRRAFEEGRTLEDLKGVPASLRAAFGYAVAESVGRDLGVPVSPVEVRAHVLAIAAGGRDVAARELRRLETERRRFAEDAARRAQAVARARTPVLPVAPRAAPGPRDDGEARAAQALRAAGAELLACRQRGGDQMEVTYRFEGERFVSIVDASSLQVIDAGICLSGADRMVTLDSLPSVIREGIELGVLVITRRS